MKKIIIIMLTVFCLVSFSKKEYSIPKDSIRLRIVPNSNSSRDIIMKEKAVYEVNNVIKEFNNESIIKSRQSIISNIDNIENKLSNLFDKNEYERSFNIKYGYNYFPEKTYNNINYEEGEYESLVIEIGEAKGNNYWCVLYPPLCLIDEKIEKIEYKSKLLEIIDGLL